MTTKCYTYTCTQCGESKSASDHTHRYFLIGYLYDDLYEYGCIDCDADFIDAPHTHDYKLIESCDVSCTKDGYRKYQCEECGDSYTTDCTPALGHVLVEIDRDGTDSTGKSENSDEWQAICIASWNIYYSCTRCGEEVAVEQEPLFPDGHPDYEDCPDAYYTHVYENIKFDGTRLVCGKCGYFAEDPYVNGTDDIFDHVQIHGGSNWISKTVTLARRETGYFLECRYCDRPYTELYNFGIDQYGIRNLLKEPQKYLPDWFVQKYFGHVYYGSIAGEAYWLKYVETGLSGTAEDNPGDDTYPDWVKENTRGSNGNNGSSSSFKNLSAVLFGDVFCPVVKGTRAGTVVMY